MSIIVTPQNEVNSCTDYNCKLEKIQPYLWSFIRARVFNESDSKDLLQETFLKLHEQRHKYNPNKNFYNWALTIARFQIMAYQTMYKRKKMSAHSQLHDNIAMEKPKDYKKLEMQQKALINCIQNMPKHMKAIAFLRFRRSLTMNQISKIVSRPVGSVSATLFRIREKINETIHDKYNEIEIENDKSPSFY